MGKFEIKKDKSGDFRFNLIASNGQVILSSQGYSSKAACENGIASVKTNAKDDSKYERDTAKGGKHYFNLLAANKQVIGTSQQYSSTAAMENGIASVMTNAVGAAIEDKSSAK